MILLTLWYNNFKWYTRREAGLFTACHRIENTSKSVAASHVVDPFVVVIGTRSLRRKLLLNLKAAKNMSGGNFYPHPESDSIIKFLNGYQHQIEFKLVGCWISSPLLNRVEIRMIYRLSHVQIEIIFFKLLLKDDIREYCSTSKTIFLLERIKNLICFSEYREFQNINIAQLLKAICRNNIGKSIKFRSVEWRFKRNLVLVTAGAETLSEIENQV